MDTSTTEGEGTSVTPAEDTPAENETVQEKSFSVEAEPVEVDIDYKAEFEKAQKRFQKAEYTLKKKNIESKEKPEVNEDEVAEMVDRMVAERLSESQKDQARDTFSDELLTLSDNADERDLIKLHYENSIVNTGFSRTAIKEDLEKAKLLANASRYEKERKELMESAKAKQAMGSTSVGSNQAKPTPIEDLRSHFSDDEWKLMHNSPNWNEELIKKAAENKAAVT